MTLTDFLLARIAEDEEGAQWHHTLGCSLTAGDYYVECSCGHPDRVLAECEAKRRIVRHYGVINDWPLRYLALLYVDHIDFRGEWHA